MIDVGAGYQFNPWFRVDGTFEYRGGAGLQSLYTLTDPASPSFGGPLQYADFYRANVSSFIGLLNGYANLGNWYGISPFVGGGVGVADNNVSGFTDQGLGYADYTSLGPAGGDFSNGSKTSFAWALMAGLDFNVSPNLKLELGYRYLNYGSIGTGGSNCLAGNSGGTFSNVNCNGGVAELHLVAQYARLQRFPARPHLHARRGPVASASGPDRDPVLGAGGASLAPLLPGQAPAAGSSRRISRVAFGGGSAYVLPAPFFPRGALGLGPGAPGLEERARGCRRLS